MITPSFRIGVILTLLVTSLLLPYRARACSCIDSFYMTEWERTDAIFLGTVTNIHTPVPSSLFSSTDLVVYTFKPHHVWKGENWEEVTVESTSVESCGASFRQDETYMVYAFGPSNGLYTYLCTLNHPAYSTWVYRHALSAGIEKIRTGLGFTSLIYQPF